MGRRLRCSECRRLLILEGEPPTNIPLPDGIEQVLPQLVPWAREYIAATPDGECQDVIDFLDFMALNVKARDYGHEMPAGQPSKKGKAA